VLKEMSFGLWSHFFSVILNARERISHSLSHAWVEILRCAQDDSSAKGNAFETCSLVLMRITILSRRKQYQHAQVFADGVKAVFDVGFHVEN